MAEDRIPVEVMPLLKRNAGKLLLPSQLNDYPHPAYLKKHRDNFFNINHLLT